MKSETISHGTPEAYREFIHEMAGLAKIQAEMVMKYAEIGDDTGLSYAARQWLAYTKAAVETLKDLRSLKQAEEFR